MTTAIDKYPGNVVARPSIASDPSRGGMAGMPLTAVTREPNGNWSLTRNGQTFALPAFGDNSITELEDLLKIRHFLKAHTADFRNA